MSDFNRNENGAGTGDTVTFDADLPANNAGSVEFTPSTSSLQADTTGMAEALTDTTTGSAAPASTSTDTDTAAGKAKVTAQTLKDEAGKLGQQASEKARGIADEGKLRATGALDDLSRMMEDAATTVDEKLGAQYGQYARSAAQTVSGLSDQLRAKEVEELVDDAREFVRKSPAIAIGTAAALGFVLARIVKAGIDTAADATDTKPAA